MPKRDDLWVPESLFNDDKFWSLTPLQYRFLLSMYDGVYDVEVLYKNLCFFDGKRSVCKKSMINQGKKLKGIFYDSDGETMSLTYVNRIGKTEYYESMKERGVRTTDDLNKKWKDYVRKTPNPIRIRRETLDYIMNNKISIIQMKSIMYVLMAYGDQNRKEFSMRYVDIANLFGINTNTSRYYIEIKNSMEWIMKSVNSGFLKGHYDRKRDGERGRVLVIKIRE